HTRSKRDWSSDVCSSDLFLFLCHFSCFLLFSLSLLHKHTNSSVLCAEHSASYREKLREIKRRERENRPREGEERERENGGREKEIGRAAGREGGERSGGA